MRSRQIYKFYVKRFVTVGVVDSNPRTRQGLIRRLRRMPGISMLGEAGDRDEALRMVCEQRPDVVLMDIRIDYNGADFLSQMATAVPQSGIVILTGYVTEGERSELMRAGARAILLKEINSERLVRTIQSVAAQIAAGERMSEK